MPQVPSVQRTVQLAPLSGQTVQPADFSAGGEIVARGMGQFGEAVSNYGEQLQRNRDVIGEANTKRDLNDYSGHSNDVLHTGQNPYYSLNGRDALNARPATEQALKDHARELLQKASPDERRMLEPALTARLQDDLKGVGEFANKQADLYNLHETVARTKIAAADAVTNRLVPDVSAKSIATGVQELADRAKLEGWGPDELKANTLAYTSGIHKDIAVSFVDEGGAQGPELARRYADAHASELTGDDRQVILTHAQAQQNHIDAEQRRIEAEQRRELHEQQHDAGQAAEDTARLIERGIPVPAKAVADAALNAEKAGRPALVDLIKTGAFKNDLTVEYRDATPAQIQDRLNVLGPKIKAAGDHPNPKDVIEFDHLTTVRNNSAAELQRDMVSWGAAHLGVTVRPLNWNDPSSIAGRVQAARTTSSKTGAPVRPLTDDEAASMGPRVAVGTASEKRSILSQIAAFGPYATVAAQQIAPHDDAFVGLAGLATARNRSVAAIAVTRALAGAEVLKTNPKLIDEGRATTDFRTFVGGALQIMQGTERGVFANAKAIAAAKMHDHGVPDYKSGGSDYLPNAINDALGAYTRNGVQYGGIGTWKNAKIVLPEDMSQQDFDLKLSKSSAPQMLRASNGVPVWHDGHTLTLGELRSKRLVAVGNGVYRLSDEAGNFVMKKGGGPYELDVTRIH